MSHDDADQLRDDITMLRVLIDAALDMGMGAEDAILRACTEILREREERLELLESPT